MRGMVFNMDGTKYCSNCGTQIDEEVNICPECELTKPRYERV